VKLCIVNTYYKRQINCMYINNHGISLIHFQQFNNNISTFTIKYLQFLVLCTPSYSLVNNNAIKINQQHTYRLLPDTHCFYNLLSKNEFRSVNIFF
jgi:hypothetical protein